MTVETWVSSVGFKVLLLLVTFRSFKTQNCIETFLKLDLNFTHNHIIPYTENAADSHALFTHCFHFFQFGFEDLKYHCTVHLAWRFFSSLSSELWAFIMACIELWSMKSATIFVLTKHILNTVL